MSSNEIFSTPTELSQIADILANYTRLPFSVDSIPGKIMESILAHVRGGVVLGTYDFVDVVNERKRVGWQVKSTKESTPVTWKRAKIPNADELIKNSRRGARGLQLLGNAIIDFCNHHAEASLQAYKLDVIGYSRLVVRETGEAIYFERRLITKKYSQLFNPAEFKWRWSSPKVTRKKEQLSALHGIHRISGEKWFAWHGLGENQLHFSGEHAWWPRNGDVHAITFRLPRSTERLSLNKFIELLAGIANPSSEAE